MFVGLQYPQRAPIFKVQNKDLNGWLRYFCWHFSTYVLLNSHCFNCTQIRELETIVNEGLDFDVNSSETFLTQCLKRACSSLDDIALALGDDSSSRRPMKDED